MKQQDSSFKSLQQQEIDGSVLYHKIAMFTKNETERKTLLAISSDEHRHAKTFEKYTGIELKPRRIRIFLFNLAAHLFGYTFIIKLLERSEDKAIKAYEKDINKIPELKEILREEEEHEEILLNMLNEERLKYVGDIVLGMNDALVELTGTLAGLTFALANTRLVALSGIITGVSATLSMAASNYLAERANGSRDALKSSLYTGMAYLITVILMVLPYLLLPNSLYAAAFAIMLAVVVLIILLFNFYISVAKSTPFLRRFGEMAVISLGVAAISFVIGLIAKSLLGVDI